MIKTLIMLTVAGCMGFLSATAIAENAELSDEQARVALQQIVVHPTLRARPEDKKEIAILLSNDNTHALLDGRKQFTDPSGQCRQIRSSSFFDCTIEFTYQLPGDRELTHPITHITFTAVIGINGEVSVLAVKEYFKYSK